MSSSKVITKKRVQDICDKVENDPTQKSIAQFIRIFRICVSQNSDEDTEEQSEQKREQDFIIDDAGVYDQVVTFALQKFPRLLKQILNLKEDDILVNVTSRKLEIVLKVYLLNVVKMAENVHEEDMLVYILRFYPLITDFMHPVKQLFNRFLKYMIELWSTSNNLHLKLQSFLVIRRIAKQTQPDQVDKIFRRVYVAYFDSVKHMSWRTYEAIIFMINCFSELMTENKESAYYIGFSYLRQIAVLLKTNMDKKTDEKKVFNWQVVNSIRLWGGVISKLPSEQDMGQLLYPLIQLITGINQYSTATEYIPLKFHLIQVLNVLSQKTNITSPVLILVKDILNSGEFRKKKLHSSKKPFDFGISIKIDNKYKNTTVLYNEIFKMGLDLSAQYLAIFSRDISFPEISYNYIKYLKKLSDQVTFNGYKIQIKQLLKAIYANIDLIHSRRKIISFAPRNTQSVLSFPDDNFSDVKDTPLELVSHKIQKERDQHIRQRILAEKDQIYDDENQEDEEGEGEGEDNDNQDEDGKQKNKNKDMDLADASDSDAFDPENYKDSDEEEEEEEIQEKKGSKNKKNQKKKVQEEEEEEEDEYDLENMDYEGDPEDLPDFDLIDENDGNGEDSDDEITEEEEQEDEDEDDE